MKYIIVATEYLTKWVEAKVVKVDDAKATATFLYENVITRFGCPKMLISDRSKHFLNVNKQKHPWVVPLGTSHLNFIRPIKL